MASHRSATFTDTPYTDPNPLPSSVPHVDELGVTSAPLKSASFFIGQHCKDVNGQWGHLDRLVDGRIKYQVVEVPGLTHTRGLYAVQIREPRPRTLLERGPESDTVCCRFVSVSTSYNRPSSYSRIGKMRESCLQEFDAHWQCLEKNNQYFQACRKPEKALNDCVFSKLVSLS